MIASRENKPLVSIALCTYNGEQYLGEQLESLITQSYANLEVVVVDDCSTDGTVALLTKYSMQDQRLKMFSNQTNLGYSRNFEKAISLCTGEFIALCDQDDIWNADKIEILLREIGDNILIYHDSEFIAEDGSLMNKRMSEVVNFYSGNDPSVFLFFNCVSGHSVLFRKKLVEHILPFTPGVFYDAWIAFSAVNIGSVNFIPDRLVKYRQHRASSTDILKRKSREQRNESASKRKKIESTLEWLRLCASRAKDEVVIKKIAGAYEERLYKLFSFSLFFLLILNVRRLMFIYKKPLINKLGFAFRNSWGKR